MTESDTRSALISAAADLLDEGGPAAVTLREVGARAGVSHNAPYKHFAGKEDLLAAVAARELERQARGAHVHAKSPPGAPLAQLRTAMHGYIRWARTYPQRFKLTFGAWSTENEDLGEAAAAARAGLIDLAAAAQKARELPPGEPERLAYLFLALAHGAADLELGGHLAADGKGRASPEDLIDDLIALVRQNRR
jgi:AcrR family transcriptional regulator